MKVTLIPVLIGPLGTVIEGLEQGLEGLEIRGRLHTIQTTELLRLARIQKTRLEETCCHLGCSGKPSANAVVKSSQMTKIIIIVMIILIIILLSSKKSEKAEWHKVDDNASFYWCNWKVCKDLEKRAGRIGNLCKNWDHPDHRPITWTSRLRGILQICHLNCNGRQSGIKRSPKEK